MVHQPGPGTDLSNAVTLLVLALVVVYPLIVLVLDILALKSVWWHPRDDMKIRVLWTVGIIVLTPVVAIVRLVLDHVRRQPQPVTEPSAPPWPASP
jgi:hypothetical protein